MKILILSLIIFISCTGNQQSVVELKNESGFQFDSIRLRVNNQSFLISELRPSGTATVKFDRAPASETEDIVYSFKGYIGELLRLNEVLFSKDPGNIPKKFKGRITRDLRIETR